MFRAVAPVMSVCDLCDIALKYHNQKLIETKTLVVALSGIYRTQESSAYCQSWVFFSDCHSVLPRLFCHTEDYPLA